MDRVERIVVKRRAVESVRLSPSDEDVGCHFVLNGMPVHRLGRLLSDRSELDSMLDELGQPRAQFFRYTLNLLVAAKALPEGMARNVFLIDDERTLAKEPLCGSNPTAYPTGSAP